MVECLSDSIDAGSVTCLPLLPWAGIINLMPRMPLLFPAAAAPANSDWPPPPLLVRTAVEAAGLRWPMLPACWRTVSPGCCCRTVNPGCDCCCCCCRTATFWGWRMRPDCGCWPWKKKISLLCLPTTTTGCPTIDSLWNHRIEINLKGERGGITTVV